jgi:DNA processing protein
MAVPGPVTSTMSAAPHLMIRDAQASLVTGAADVLELVSSMGSHLVTAARGPARPTDGLDPNRLAVYEAVPGRRRAGAGDIALKAGVALPICLAELAALEDDGLVEADTGGWRITKPPLSPND